MDGRRRRKRKRRRRKKRRRKRRKRRNRRRKRRRRRKGRKRRGRRWKVEDKDRAREEEGGREEKELDARNLRAGIVHIFSKFSITKITKNVPLAHGSPVSWTPVWTVGGRSSPPGGSSPTAQRSGPLHPPGESQTPQCQSQCPQLLHHSGLWVCVSCDKTW